GHAAAAGGARRAPGSAGRRAAEAGWQGSQSVPIQAEGGAAAAAATAAACRSGADRSAAATAGAADSAEVYRDAGTERAEDRDTERCDRTCVVRTGRRYYRRPIPHHQNWRRIDRAGARRRTGPSDDSVYGWLNR